MRTILLINLNYFNYAFALLLSYLGYRIGFLTIIKEWQSDVKINNLKQKGFYHLSYEDYKIDNAYNIYKRTRSASITILNRLKKSLLHKNLSNNFHIGSEHSKELEIVVLEFLKNKIHNHISLITFAEHFIKNKIFDDVKIYIPDNYFAKTVQSDVIDIKYIFPVWPRIFYDLLFFLYRALLSVKNKLFLVKHKNNNNKVSSNLNSTEVIFFPHKGIFYSYIYIKDQFYSNELDSPFHPENILHIKLGENDDEIKEAIKYYKKNNIPYCDYQDLNYESKIILLFYTLSYIFKSLNFFDRNSYGIEGVKLYSDIFLQLRNSICNLNSLPNVKYALAGYDVLFPKIISLACRMLNISTIATQERFLLTWTPFQDIIFDYYYVIGPRVIEQIKESKYCSIKNIEPIGPIRLDDIFYESKNKEELKRKINKNEYRKIVLVLDFHSEETEYKNGLLIGNCWRNNLQFYNDIIEVSKRFSDMFFLIKGKNADFLNIPYFTCVKEKIEKSRNITVINDFLFWTPYKVAAIADYTIALHTSLGDEILASGKPVIFYDYFGFPSSFFSYDDYPLIAHDYSSLVGKLIDIDNNCIKSLINNIKKDYYSDNYNGNIKNNLRKRLGLLYAKKLN